MAHAAALIPSEMTITTAVAILIVIAALTAGVGFIGWSFTRQTPTRRRDLIELVRALRGGSRRR